MTNSISAGTGNIATIPTVAAEEIKSRHGNDTRGMVREMAALLFFQHGETPTANRIYSLLRKGSMTTVHEAMTAFWEEIRKKSTVRLISPDVPSELLDHYGQAVAVAWQLSCKQAGLEFDQMRKELARETKNTVDLANNSVNAAQQLAESIQQEANAARLSAAEARQERRGAEERSAKLQAELAATTELATHLQTQLSEQQEQLSTEKARALADQAYLQSQLAAQAAEHHRDREITEGLRTKALADIDQARQETRLAKEDTKALQIRADREVARMQAQNLALEKEMTTVKGEKASLQQKIEAVTGREAGVSEERDRLRQENKEMKAQINALLLENGRLSVRADQSAALAGQLEDLKSKARDFPAETGTVST